MADNDSDDDFYRRFLDSDNDLDSSFQGFLLERVAKDKSDIDLDIYCV